MKTLSQAGLVLIKSFEGLKLTASINKVDGHWDIGFGHLINLNFEKSLLPPTVISEEFANTLLLSDVKKTEEYINKVTSTVNLTQYEYDALVSFVYNVGTSAFGMSTLLRYLKSGNKALVPNEFLRWKYSNGEVSQGLLNRRVKERLVFLGESVDVV